MSALLRRVEGGGDLGTANIAIVVLDEDNQSVAGVMYPSNVVKDGVVVDYLNCLFINFPVFNFADVCICVGVGLLVLSLLLDMRREQKAKQQKGSAPTDGTA